MGSHGRVSAANQRSVCKREARRINTIRKSAAMANNILRNISF
jgi:hypothetical protein